MGVWLICVLNRFFKLKLMVDFFSVGHLFCRLIEFIEKPVKIKFYIYNLIGWVVYFQ